jgi:hypothetical protein
VLLLLLLLLLLVWWLRFHSEPPPPWTAASQSTFTSVVAVDAERHELLLLAAAAMLAEKSDHPTKAVERISLVQGKNNRKVQQRLSSLSTRFQPSNGSLAHNCRALNGQCAI